MKFVIPFKKKLRKVTYHDSDCKRIDGSQVDPNYPAYLPPT